MLITDDENLCRESYSIRPFLRVQYSILGRSLISFHFVKFVDKSWYIFYFIPIKKNVTMMSPQWISRKNRVNKRCDDSVTGWNYETRHLEIDGKSNFIRGSTKWRTTGHDFRALVLLCLTNYYIDDRFNDFLPQNRGLNVRSFPYFWRCLFHKINLFLNG